MCNASWASAQRVAEVVEMKPSPSAAHRSPSHRSPRRQTAQHPQVVVECHDVGPTRRDQSAEVVTPSSLACTAVAAASASSSGRPTSRNGVPQGAVEGEGAAGDGAAPCDGGQPVAHLNPQRPELVLAVGRGVGRHRVGDQFKPPGRLHSGVAGVAGRR
jgi:hypothetical protein